MTVEETGIAIRGLLGSYLIRGVLGAESRLGGHLKAMDGAPDLLTINEAILVDADGRLVVREQSLCIQRSHLVYLAEDRRAPRLAHAKKMIAIEDYEAAAAELREILASGDTDAEVYYIAGVAEQGAGRLEDARPHFQKALDSTRDVAFRYVIQRHLAEL